MFISIVNEYYDGDVAGVEIEVWDSSTLGGSFTVKANSRRDPIDSPDEEVALLLAYGRAFEKVAKKLQKRANGKVRHNDNLRDIKKVQNERKRQARLLELAGTDLQGKGSIKASRPSTRIYDTWNKVY